MPGRGRVRGAVHVAAGRVAAPDRVDVGFARLATATGARAPGRAVHVLVRPEHVEADPPPGAPNRLEGRVGAVRYLGAVTRYDFEVPGASRPFSRKAACRSPAPSPSIPRVFACWTIDPISLAAQGASRCNADDSSRPPAPAAGGARARRCGPELYAGEKALYEAARKEGMCVSFDTGPEWANWKALFREFKQRYPDIELTYNDLGSAATVVALKDAATPAGRHRLLLRGLGGRRGAQGPGGAFPPRGLRAAARGVPRGRGRWFTVHTLNIAFLVNRKLVARAPEGWADLLKPNTGTR